MPVETSRQSVRELTAKLSTQLTRADRLRQTVSDTSARFSFAERLRAYLSLLFTMLQARSTILSLDISLRSWGSSLASSVTMCWNETNRSRGRSSSNCKLRTGVSIDLSELSEYRTFAAEFDRLSAIGHELGKAIHDLWTGIYTQYRELPRKLRPVGCREALSVCMAILSEKHGGELSSENIIFGLTKYYSFPAQSQFRYLICGISRRAHSAKGAAPSLAWGERILRSAHCRESSSSIYAERNKSSRLSRVLAYLSGSKLYHTSAIVGGRVRENTPRYPGSELSGFNNIEFLAATKCGNPVAARFLRMRCGRIHTSVPTIIAGPPQLVTTLEVMGRAIPIFSAPCLWDQDHSRPALLSTPRLCYFWSQLGAEGEYQYSLADNTYHTSLGESPDACLQSILRRCTDYLTPRATRDSGASVSYDPNRKGSETRKRRATVLRDCRSIPVVTFQDSRNAGNCAPGTREFMRQLSIVADTICGRELARRWRANNYVSQHSFAPVIDRAITAKRQQAILEANQEAIAANRPTIDGEPIAEPLASELGIVNSGEILIDGGEASQELIDLLSSVAN